MKLKWHLGTITLIRKSTFEVLDVVHFGFFLDGPIIYQHKNSYVGNEAIVYWDIIFAILTLIVTKNFVEQADIFTYWTSQQVCVAGVGELDCDGFFLLHPWVVEIWPPTELHVKF